MDARILRQDRLAEWIAALLQQAEVIAPVSEQCYGTISSPSEMLLGGERPTKSLKEMYFPQREVLFSYQLGMDARTETPPSPTSADRVIIGARPCDAAAFPILDKLFSWDYDDPFYLESRGSTSIVSLACEHACKSCFCTSLGGSPAGTEGADLLLTPLDGVYHIQVITEQGNKLVAQYAELFTDSDEQLDQQQAAFEERARSAISREINIDGLAQKLDFENPVWETIAQQCIDCGICTFLCPTCHCFDIQDEGTPREGERVRCWDACTFYNYTKTHAGQPRPQHYRRYRQRIMHKFRYYPENFGPTLCVGCGRCIEHCPVNIDLIRVLESAKE